MPSGPFLTAMEKAAGASINFGGNAFKALLVTHDVLVAARENTDREVITHVDGTGATDWSAAGTEVQTVENGITRDDAGAGGAVHLGLGSEVLVFPTVTADEVCQGVVIHKTGSGSSATNYNVFYCKFAEAVTADGGPMTVTLHPDGFGSFAYTE